MAAVAPKKGFSGKSQKHAGHRRLAAPDPNLTTSAGLPLRRPCPCGIFLAEHWKNKGQIDYNDRVKNQMDAPRGSPDFRIM
jgi:hypothetical protein